MSEVTKKQPTRNRQPLRAVAAAVLSIIGLLFLTIAGYGFWDYWNTTHGGDAAPKPDVVIQEETTVSERNPGPITNDYTVARGEPRAISLTTLGIEGYIQKVGVLSNGEMATPNNLYFAGWYIRGVTPGDEGLSIINGHAGGRYSDGIFRHLGNLAKDDKFAVQMGDLSWRKFKVTSVQVYGVVDAAAALFRDDPAISKELHLITCDGNFDDSKQTYDQRLIVVAEMAE